MPRPSCEYWNDRAVLGASENRDNDRGNENDRGCDCRSARALKEILSLLDDLNNEDLRLLEEILDRIICERRR